MEMFLLICVGLVAAAYLVDKLAIGTYQKNLEAGLSSNNAVALRPEIKSFRVAVPVNEPDRELYPHIGFDTVLPHGTQLHIFRTPDAPPSDIEDAKRRGILVINTQVEENLSDLPKRMLIDYEISDGIWFYTPYIVGRHVEKVLLERTFWSTQPQYGNRNRDSLVTYGSTEIPFHEELYKQRRRDLLKKKAVPDNRSDIQKTKDSIIGKIKENKKRRTEIERVVEEIQNDIDLSDDEKSLAIEEIEIRSESH